MVILFYLSFWGLLLLSIFYIFGYFIDASKTTIKDKVPEIKKTSTSLNFCAGELQKYFHTKDLLVEKYLNTFNMQDGKIYVNTHNIKHFHEAIMNDDVYKVSKLQEFFLESIKPILVSNNVDKSIIEFII